MHTALVLLVMIKLMQLVLQLSSFKTLDRLILLLTCMLYSTVEVRFSLMGLLLGLLFSAASFILGRCFSHCDR